MDHDFEHEARGIDKDVPDASIHLLAPIITMRSTSLRHFHRLTVDDASTWSGFTSDLDSTAFPQRRHDLFPHSVIPKEREIAVHGGTGRLVSRQHAPSATTAQHIKDPIENRSHLDLSWSSIWLLRRNQRLQNGPFFIGEIRGIHFHQLPSLSGLAYALLFTFTSFYLITWVSPSFV